MSGIACTHALSCIFYMKYQLEDFVDPYFKKENYYNEYKYALEPLNGSKMWHRVDEPCVMPPVYRNMPGRPKKNRKINKFKESTNTKGSLNRLGVIMTCKYCLENGNDK